MPKLIEAKEIKLEWSDINSRQIKTPGNTTRSPGVHLSGVIKHVLRATGDLGQDDLGDEMPLRMAVGMAWEEWAVGMWQGLDWQPGECSKDGVTGSPDGVSRLSYWDSEFLDLLEEFKATWKSQHKYGDILSQKLWIWQLMGYCHMMGLTKARIHILWVNGDYRPPGPKYMTYLIEFSKKELEEFWKRIVLNNKDEVKAE